MTAPIQPLPIPNVAPGQFIPAPSTGDIFAQTSGDLAKVLQAIQAMQSQSQIQNREIDVRRELGMGGLDVQRTEQSRMQNQAAYDQSQDAAKLQRDRSAGQGLYNVLPPELQRALGGVDQGVLQSLIPQLEQAGVVGPMTGNQRDFNAYQGMPPGAPQDKFWELIGPQAGTTINNNVGAGPTAYSKSRGEELGKADVAAADASSKAFSSIAAATNARNLVDRSFTGAGANAKLNASRVLNTLGLPVAKDEVVNTQELIRYAQEGTMALLAGKALGSGTAVSDQDRAYMQRIAGEDITRDAPALKKIFRINVGAQLMSVEETVMRLRERARQYPDEARSLNAEAQSMEDRLKPMRQKYETMLQDETKGQAQVKQRGLSESERLLGRKLR